MPFVSLRITRGATERQKQDIIREFTQTLERVLHKDPAWTHIVIDEVDPADWGTPAFPSNSTSSATRAVEPRAGVGPRRPIPP